MGRITGFRNSTTGVDIGLQLVEKSYLIDRYPELADTFKQAGLWGWGASSYGGEIGDGVRVNRSSPVQTIAAGTNWKQVCGPRAIKTDGTLWTWGTGYQGQLGNNTNGITAFASSPVQTVAGGTNWKQASYGYFTTAAIKTDGTLWTWGFNAQGQLGDNTTADKSSPIQTISGGTNWKQVSCCGSYFTAAIKTDGTLWLWGRNDYGQLGTGNLTYYSSPVQTVAGGTNWKQVGCGAQGGSVYQFTAAIKTDGTLWTWGRNDRATLGDNTIDHKSSPVQTVAGGTNWKQVSIDLATVALKTDGSLWMWGENQYGQLGNNTIANKSSPVQTVAGGTNWKQVGTCGQTTVAIKTDGTLWTWGDNLYGHLGDNTTVRKSSPVQTVTGGTNWKQVSDGGAGVIHAIRDDSADIFGNPV